MYEINQPSDLHAMNVNDPLDPGFSVMPDDEPIDPDFSVMPDNDVIDPGFLVPPMNFPGGPGPVIPGPSQNRYLFVRFLNAAPEYSNLTVEVGNRTVLTDMNFADLSRYRRFGRGYHRITVIAPNGYVYLQQNVYLGTNSTIAFSTSNNRLQLDVIADTGCGSTAFNNSCLRVCNLAYYSGAVNVTLSNGLLSFTNTRPGQAGSFSRMQSGSYPVSVARSARPYVNLLSTYINLAPGRTHTLYVLNWNPSPDAVRILLAEDVR